MMIRAEAGEAPPGKLTTAIRLSDPVRPAMPKRIWAGPWPTSWVSLQSSFWELTERSAFQPEISPGKSCRTRRAYPSKPLRTLWAATAMSRELQPAVRARDRARSPVA